MREPKWFTALKQVARAVLFSLGIALGLIMLSSVGWMVLTDGERALDASEARVFFTIAFAVSLISYAVVAFVRGNRDDACRSRHDVRINE